MKKLLFAIGSIIVGGTLVTGIATTQADAPNPKPNVEKAEVKQAEAKEDLTKNKTILEIETDEVDFDQYQVEKTEYTDLVTYVKDTANNLKDGSEYLSYQSKDTAVMTLANAALHYVNYFEDEIKAKGMTEEFEALQRLAFEVGQENARVGDGGESFQTKAKEFEQSVNKISNQF